MSYDKKIPYKPIAPNDDTRARWSHTEQRRKLIQGTWSDLLEEELYRHLPADRRESWGVADMSSNALEQVTRQLSQLYHEQPKVTVEPDQDISDLIGRNGYVTQAGFFQLMQRVQQYTLAMRECCVRIDVTPPDTDARVAGITYRIVTPDFVYAESHADAPDTMVYYQEYRLRYNHIEDEYEWVCDIIDCKDLNEPKFGMYKIKSDGSIGEDVSDMYMGSPALTGSNYPYRGSDGLPFIPVQLYHAEKTSQLFNPYDGATCFFGTLSSAVLFSFYLHLVRDSCWSQKYISNLHLAGQNSVDQEFAARRNTVTTDPSSILVFTSDPDNTTQPMIGSFEPSADPLKMLESITAYEARIASSSGITGGNVLKTSGDPRSGYAISLDRSQVREVQKKFAPVFRLNDEELIAKTAKLCNRYLKTNLPEKGYRVQYQQLQMSPEETKELRTDVIEKLKNGLISPVDAIMILNPDLDEIGAKNELMRIRKERAEFM